MARKSASPFYGLNNMLAVEEEEDEGGWGVVSFRDQSISEYILCLIESTFATNQYQNIFCD